MRKTHSLQSQKIWKLPAKLLNLPSPWNPQNYRPRVNDPCRRFLHSLPVFVQTSHTASPKPHQLSREIRCSMVCRKAKMFHDQFYKLLLSQTFPKCNFSKLMVDFFSLLQQFRSCATTWEPETSSNFSPWKINQQPDLEMASFTGHKRKGMFYLAVGVPVFGNVQENFVRSNHIGRTIQRVW